MTRYAAIAGTGALCPDAMDSFYAAPLSNIPAMEALCRGANTIFANPLI